MTDPFSSRTIKLVRKLLLLLFLCFSLWFSKYNSFSYRFYKVTGPKGIRPNSEYNVAISVQGTSVPTVVRAAIQGASYVGRPYSTEDVVTVPPYSTKIARLEVT